MAENAFKADWPSFALGFNTGKSKGGGGVELNIAYGDTPPEDTTKIWVKSQKPEKVRVEPLDFSEVIDYPLTESLFYSTNSSNACVSIGDKIYRVGRTSGYASKLTVYDTKTGKTVDLTRPPVDVANWPTLVAINDNELLLIASSSVYKYYIDTNSWGGKIGAFPDSSIYGRPSSYVDGFVYFFGGRSGYDKEIYKFNIETLEVTTCEAAFSAGRYGTKCVAIGAKIYLFGGTNSSQRSMNYAGCYDTTNDTLSDLKKMPKPRKKHGVSLYGDDIVIYGGYNETGTYSTSGYLENMILYHPSSNTYSNIDATIPKPREIDASEVVDAKVYIMPDEFNRETIDIVNLLPPVENGTVAMHHRTDGTKIPIINAENLHIDTNIGGTYMGDENNVGQSVEALMFKDGEWTNI